MGVAVVFTPSGQLNYNIWNVVVGSFIEEMSPV